MKTRFEKKYLVPPNYVESIRSILSHSCVKDRKYKQDTVCSLYFDATDMRAYDEVLNGDICKEKLRFRWYESSTQKRSKGTIPVYLELKRKEGARGGKNRKKMTLPRKMLQPPLHVENFLTEELQGAFAEIGGAGSERHHPVLVLKYRRDRFFDPFTGLRICLDSDIRVTDVNARVLPRGRPVRTNKAVLEIKGELFSWPKSLNILEPLPLRTSAFSKYAYCLDACRFDPELAGKWG